MFSIYGIWVLQVAVPMVRVTAVIVGKGKKTLSLVKKLL